MKNVIILLVFFFISLFVFSCEATDPGEPPEVRPPGYQEEIPWPSLADSPWPMALHDPQGTGRSSLPGPLNGQIVWEYQPAYLTWGFGVAIGNDSTFVYNADSLFLFSPNGEKLWSRFISSYSKFNTPTIDKNGNIYCCSNSDIFSFDKAGNLRWKYEPQPSNLIKSESVGIDKFGNVYFFNSSYYIFALDSQGNELWKLENNFINPGLCSPQMTFSPEGDVIYFPGRGKTVVALDLLTQTIKWTYGDGLIFSHIAIDNSGNLHFYDEINEKFESVNPQGELRWSNNVAHRGTYCDSAPSIDWQGNIYYSTDTLYSFDYYGNLRWKYNLQYNCDAPIIVDKDNNIYVETYGSTTLELHIYSFNSEGSLRWSLETQNLFSEIGGSPAITYKNEMIVPIASNKIIIIK